jgi:phosphoribosylaminoimidazole-succinocarboxamide synthase
MREPVPYKGAVLTQITAWWLKQLEPTLRHHMISADISEIIEKVPSLSPYERSLAGRSMLSQKATVFPVECVIRGYISGSAWKEYAASGTLAGEKLPDGLRESGKLPAPIFSPATKAEEGHDENITVSQMAEAVGSETAAELERLSRLVYDYGTSVADKRGIIIADTKFEFGYLGNAAEFDASRVILVDEVLTPDSSRFWPADRFEPGRSQASFDKQPLRDYLDGERREGRWNGDDPPPRLPPEVISAMTERYLDIFRRLTLTSLDIGALD